MKMTTLFLPFNLIKKSWITLKSKVQFHYMYLDIAWDDFLTCWRAFAKIQFSSSQELQTWIFIVFWKVFLFASCNCHTQLSDLSCLEHEVKSFLYIHLMDLPSKLGEAKKKELRRRSRDVRSESTKSWHA